MSPYSSVAFRYNQENYQSKRTDLDKNNTERKVDKALPGRIFNLYKFKIS